MVIDRARLVGNLAELVIDHARLVVNLAELVVHLVELDVDSTSKRYERTHKDKRDLMQTKD